MTANSSGPLRSEFFRYLVASAVALGVDVGIYQALGLAGVGYAIGAAVGFGSGMVVVYVLSVRWVFAERSVEKRAVEFIVFALVGVVGLVITELALLMLIGHWHVDRLAAKLAAAGLVFLFNFATRKAMLFTRHAARPGSFAMTESVAP